MEAEKPQMGTYDEYGNKRNKKENGCLLDGKEWKQMPKARIY